jgi:hypothetical protein
MRKRSGMSPDGRGYSFPALAQRRLARIEDVQSPPAWLDPVELGGDLVLRRSAARALGEIDLDTFGIRLTACAVLIDKSALDALACGSVPLHR